MRRLAHSGLPQVMAFLLVVTQLPVTAQAPAQASPQPAAPPVQAAAPLPIERSLEIRVLAGQDEANDLQRLIMAPLVVQVVDQNQRPVEGAEVVFRFPVSGPGAFFTGGKTSQTVHTNGDGQAAATNWRANDQTGTFQVHVTATYANQQGEKTFSMSNSRHVVQEGTKAKRVSWWSHTWAKAAVIGGAAALVAGIVLATRGGGKSSGSTITITPGGPTVGGPH
ncbi:MAG TPA: hypothetical protein VMU80_09525 [Bryobacteraceae bacterium]|nr:hypothetical protein [Bryobacteraceae bacterium]HUO29446.1 hypothetical protein [Bryobacteraceae bacterium]